MKKQNNSRDSLGDRIKKYEAVFNTCTVSRMPLIIRVDGRAFHTFTKGCSKPFDGQLIQAMIDSAIYVAEDMSGFKAAYVQSDECTFCLTDYDGLNTQGWFNYELSKVVSISASLMTAAFNHFYKHNKNILPVFDSRAFTVPKEEVPNVLLWRAKDWERNSLQMFCRAYFSHKQLQGKKKAEMHEMLHSIGKNWSTDLAEVEKNGTFLVKTESGIEIKHDVAPTYESINNAVGHLFV